MPTDIGNIALVSYIDGPLAVFLDSLRLQLTPASSPRAHVTILPPRQLTAPASGEIDLIEEQIREVCSDYPPFQAELGEVRIFPGSNVIYLDLLRGGEHFSALHQQLNVGMLKFDSGYRYHPHVTLAQGLTVADALALLPSARGSWGEFKGSRCFEIDAITLVREDNFQSWSDLAQIPCGSTVQSL